MPMTPDELADAIRRAEATDDLQRLDALEDCFRVRKDDPDVPYSVPVAFKPSKVRAPGGTAAESDQALTFANALSRARRRVAYRFKRRGNYTGPVVVAEGDSWFEYPILLDDVIDHLMREFAVLSLAGAGDLLADMAAADEFSAAVATEGADFLLLSGGGNDMLGGGRLAEFVRPFQPGMTAEQVFRPDAFAGFVAATQATYRGIMSRVTAAHPRLTVLCHGYDYALPEAGGRWLGEPLKTRGVPAPMWPAVVRVVIDRFNEGLKALEAEFPGRVYHVDCRGVVGAKPEWYDELHPRDAGYGRAAARFAERIRSAVAGRSVELARPVAAVVRGPDEPVSSPEAAAAIIGGATGESAEAIIDPRAADPFAPRVIDPPRRNRPADPPPAAAELAAWQRSLSPEDRTAYQHYLELWETRNVPDEPERVETRRELLPGNDAFQLERIIGRSDIFQVNFLTRGARAARAVGRINVMNRYGISLGFGTGFLVAPGLLLTNHHVLDDPALVGRSHVLFDYEYDADNGLRPTEQFALTGDVFVTSGPLDFTFVSVAPTGRTGRPLPEYGRLVLVRESGKALKGEYVSIVQHAGGLPKQIAMRDSQVLGRRAQFIYYTTDTNPGSSGAPVVNDEWLPVALHHRAVPDPNVPRRYVCNRGIRVSAIYEELDAAARRGDAGAAAVLRALGDEGTAPAPAAAQAGVPGAGGAPAEALVMPYRDGFDQPRGGYDPNFLGVPVPLPTLKKPAVAAVRTDTGGRVLDYEHFAAVVHRKRRMALFTASNVDARPARKRPEPGRDYTRRGLSGLGENDRERWFPDPRLAEADQLPDRFYDKDGGAFDKGHLVRREDVAWGGSYAEVRRANGDTYHLTNCSPQVAGFNRSQLDGLWGNLENVVLKQARAERCTVFAGPVLDPSDRVFVGRDVAGEVRVQIPAKYWKLVVARDGAGLAAFAFVLEQDLSDVPLEFTLNAEWRARLVPVAELEATVRHLRFPAAVRDADQAAGPLERLEMVAANEWLSVE